MERNVLIVEDNTDAAQIIEKILKTCEINTELVWAKNMEEALLALANNVFDLMIIDVVLDSRDSRDISGIKFAQMVRKMNLYRFVPIIITTSLEDPKMIAYSELHCYRYLEKPYDIDEATEIIKEALLYKTESPINENYVFKRDGILFSVKLCDIVYIENIGKNMTMYTVNDSFRVPYQSLAKMLKHLNSNDFAQCNRSCIVNKKYIEMVDTINRYIRLKNVSKQIEIGSYIGKKTFMEKYNA